MIKQLVIFEEENINIINETLRELGDEVKEIKFWKNHIILICETKW